MTLVDVRKHVCLAVARGLQLRRPTHFCLPADLGVAIGVPQEESTVNDTEPLNAHGEGVGQLCDGVGNDRAAMTSAGGQRASDR